MNRSAFAVIAAIFAIFLVAPQASADFNVSDAAPGVVDFVGIDLDTSGNSLTHVSTVQPSRWVQASTSVQVDIVIDEVDPSDLISGFDATLLYDQTKVNITGINASMLLSAQSGANIVSSGNSVPDSDGSFVISIDDTGPNHESGEGVLVRLTVACVGTGPALLNLDAPGQSSTKGAPLDDVGAPIFVRYDGQGTIYCGYAPTFAPTTAVRLCNAMPAAFADAQIAGNPACTENRQVNAFADMTVTTDINSSTYLPDTTITFVPGQTTIVNGTVITPGAKLGGIRTVGTVGVSNGPCNGALTVDTVLYNVAPPNNTSDPRASTNIAYPRPAGDSDRFGGWQIGSEPALGGGTSPGTAPRADGNSIAIQNYPKFLLDAFDPDFAPGVGDGPLLPVIPLAVYGGLSNVMGVWQPTYVAQFEASGANSLATVPQYQVITDPDMGKPSVTIVGDPTASLNDPASPITDECSPATITTTLLSRDTANTTTRATNSSLGATNFYLQYLASERDTDQDGIENQLDTCPGAMNAGTARSATGDMDGDGVDDVCDNVNATGGSDQDTDGPANRVDNCPQAVNTTQAQAELPVAADSGPYRDAIGDACDSELGAITIVQNRSSGTEVVPIAASDSIANGRYMIRLNHTTKCLGTSTAGGTDADADGYCAAQDSAGESGACQSSVPPSCGVRHTQWAGASHPLLQIDTDDDAFTDALETYMGTDPQKSCAMTPVPPVIAGGVNDEQLDNWPLDYNDDRLVSILDVGAFSARFGLPVSAPVNSTRYDLTGDGLTTILDIGKFSPVFGLRCGSGAGTAPGPFVQQ